MRYAVSTDDLVRLYEVDLLTMQEIADRLGMTKQAVWHRLKKVAGSQFKALSVPRTCGHCVEPFTTNRKRIRQGVGKYCSIRCYQSDVSVHGRYSKAGQREGRKLCGAKTGEVVHHIDGDTMNNAGWNLVVFPSNASHMSFHKSGKAERLKGMLFRFDAPEWGGPHNASWAYFTLGVPLPADIG